MSPDPEYIPVEDTKEEDVGPLKERGCTDIICLLIFVVFLAGMVITLFLILGLLFFLIVHRISFAASYSCNLFFFLKQLFLREC